MQTDNLIDPKDKDLEENQSTQPEENEDVVYLVNDDGQSLTTVKEPIFRLIHLKKRSNLKKQKTLVNKLKSP